LSKRTKPVKQEANQDRSTQDWLPFNDVTGSFIYRRDGELVAVLRVEPLNLALKSEHERKRIITSVHEALNGQLNPLQITSLPRPVDLDSYLEKLVMMAKDTVKPIKRKLLQEYIQYVAAIVRGGEAVEHRYYILLSKKVKKQAEIELNREAYELSGLLSGSGLKISLCDDMQILDMIMSFLNPVQAAFEEVPVLPGITSLYKGG
jgi:hypothetical protein